MCELEYAQKIENLMKTSLEKNKETIHELSRVLSDNIKEDRIIHTFGTGHSHMIGIELFRRAGGLGNVNALTDPDTVTSNGASRSGALEKLCGLADIIYDSYKINKGDLMIISSNSGRNAVPIEMAMRCRKEGVITVAVTNVAHSSSSSSKHPSGKRLFEWCDYVLDTCVPFGDTLIEYEGSSFGPGSSIISMYLLNIVITEAVKLCLQEGIEVPLLKSRNVDGNNNDVIYKKYQGRIKHS